jgi:hypothetical protein
MKSLGRVVDSRAESACDSIEEERVNSEEGFIWEIRAELDQETKVKFLLVFATVKLN